MKVTDSTVSHMFTWAGISRNTSQVCNTACVLYLFMALSSQNYIHLLFKPDHNNNKGSGGQSTQCLTLWPRIALPSGPVQIVTDWFYSAKFKWYLKIISVIKET